MITTTTRKDRMGWITLCAALTLLVICLPFVMEAPGAPAFPDEPSWFQVPFQAGLFMVAAFLTLQAGIICWAGRRLQSGRWWGLAAMSVLFGISLSLGVAFYQI